MRRTRTGITYTAKPTGPRTYSAKAQYQRPGYQSGPRPSHFAPTSRQSAIVPETKYFDVGINATVTAGGNDWSATEVPCDNYINSSGASAAYTDSALIPSAIGSGYGQINGNRYKLKKLRVRGSLSVTTEQTATVADVAQQVRLLLVMDTQPNGAQAQGEDIMQDIGAGAECLFSFKRVAESSGRFRILKDKFITLQPAVAVNNASATTVSTAYNSAVFKLQYQPKEPILVNVKSGNSSPTVAGLGTCNIFMLAYRADPSGAAGVLVRAASRAYFCD